MINSGDSEKTAAFTGNSTHPQGWESLTLTTAPISLRQDNYVWGFTDGLMV